MISVRLVDVLMKRFFTMTATLDPDYPRRSFPEMIGASCLCLMVLMAVACSVDLGKLRPQPILDGSTDRPGATDATEVPSVNSDGSGGDADADTASAPPDLPGADEVARPSDVADLPVVDVATDVIATGDVSDARDLLAGEDGSSFGMDSSAETHGTGGAGGAGGTGGRGTGGTGAMGGTDGRGTGGGGGAGGKDGGGTGGSGGSGGADPDLVLWYKFDESSGTTAADSSTSSAAPHNGALTSYGTGGGSANFSTGSQVGTHALRLTPSSSSPSSGGGYVVVPALHPLAPDALSIAVWVNLAAASSAQDWERILDCATDDESTGPFFYITARSNAASTPVRFGISQTGHAGNVVQRLDGKVALTANEWHHIAIVLPAGSPYTGILYIDGEVVGTNSAMTLHLSDLAITTNNWLGRSEFSADPFFNGSLDDFRVYKRALSQQEVDALVGLR